MNPSRSEASCDLSYQVYFLRWGVVSPTPNPKVWGPPLVGCNRLLIQYIRSYPPYLEGISIHNLRTRHAVVIRDPPSRGWFTVLRVFRILCWGEKCNPYYARLDEVYESQIFVRSAFSWLQRATTYHTTMAFSLRSAVWQPRYWVHRKHRPRQCN
jgi:hypothetical protein